MKPQNSNKVAVVYTVITEPRFNLPRPNEDLGYEHICFYSGQPPEPNGWKLVQFDFPAEIDSARGSRLPKTLPHLYLPSHETSIYVDTSVQLNADTVRFLDNGFKDHLFGGILLGRTLDEEFQRVEDRRYDDLYTLRTQLARYQELDFDVSKLPVYWGGLLIRKHHEEPIRKLGERWFANILRFSRRDQLSLPVALLGLSESSIASIVGDDNSSHIHTRLVGVAKPTSYVSGDTIISGEATPEITEEYLIAEISSLRKQLSQRPSMCRRLSNKLSQGILNLRNDKSG